MPQNKIVVVGAREHNLQNITVEIPRDKLVVITGLSGSGKSSLAFDTIFAEGQRRYVESLSAYARQFLGQLDKPDVDHIDGLSPAVSIDQKGVSKNPRSTVGTVTEVYDYLRLLYARVGTPHCPECGREVSQQSAQGIVDSVSGLKDGTRIMLLAPLIKDRKGHHQTVFEGVRKSGFARVRVDGEVLDVNDTLPELDRYKLHTIEAVVDRLIVRNSKGDAQKEFATRLTDSVETALRLGQGLMLVHQMDTREDLLFSEHFACPLCGISLPELEPRSFSFNSPHGACTECQGLGHKLEIDPELVIPDQSRTIGEGAIEVMEWRNSHDEGGYYWQTLEAAAKYAGIGLDMPMASMSAEQRRLLLYGSNDEKISIQYKTRDGRNAVWNTEYEGVIPNLERRYRESTSDFIRQKIESYMSQRDCEACRGLRLRREVLAVTIDGHNIVDVTAWPVTRVLGWSAELAKSVLNKRQKTIARQILKEISARLQFMVDVGLDYLTLSRTAASLSGGEAQRIRLATQIGSQLMGVLYVLDEPSIGLHQRDNARLLQSLRGLRDLGNSVLVVEHDEEAILTADHVIDMGPAAGVHGGEVIAEGKPADIMASKRSVTGQYLTGARSIAIPKRRPISKKKVLRVIGARGNNLQDVTGEIPVGTFTCITGVSGGGKSTFTIETLYKAAARRLNNATAAPAHHDRIEGLEHFDKVVDIDQSPIGRTPRSNPATYTGAFGPIRDWFAGLPESKARGYGPGRFSFNVKGGRCEACQGDGLIKIEMHFLPDVYVTCDVCHGRRYNRETLEILFRGKTISDVLDMTVEEAADFFKAVPSVRDKMATLKRVGLGYIKVGQQATTLSGGEAQRVKLSKELSRRATGKTLYILDEPTTGLHFEDVRKLLEVLHELADAGNTVVVIEHNLDVVKTADWVLDFGPEGGDGGGQIVASGSPETIAANPESWTGRYLAELLERGRERQLKRA